MPPSANSDVLGPVDSAFYFIDSPETPMNIGAVTIFEGKFLFDQFLEWIEARIYHAPPYQKRIVETVLHLGQPRWIYDPDFTPSNHVFKHELDAPGSDEQLRELAGHLVSGMLDRSKPLWEIHLIAGLQGNRTAVLFKVHHCMVDGLSAVELFTLLLDIAPQQITRTLNHVYAPPALPTPLEMLANAASRDLSNKWSMLTKLGNQAVQFGSMLTDPDERRKTFVGLANIINNNVAPIKKLLINGMNTGRLTLAWTEFPLSEVRAIRTINKCSVNEVMLSLLGLGIEEYLEKRGETSTQKFVRVLAPVDVRAEEEKGSLGNRIAVLPIDVPFGIKDPLEHLHRVADFSQVLKQSGLSQGIDIILTLPSLAPNAAHPYIWKLAPTIFGIFAHTWCTNVVGPQMPIYLSGHKMLASYGYFPLNPSMGLACVIMSYNHRISMTLIADAGIVPDVTEIKRCLDRAYLRLRSASNIEPLESVGSEPVQEMPSVAQEPVSVATDVRPSPSSNGGSSAASLSSFAAEKAAAEAVATVAVAERTIDDTKPEPIALPIVEAAPSVAEKQNGSKPTRFKIFTEEWAQAYRESINNSMRYLNASRNWTAGSLSFILRADPQHGYMQATAVLLDLHRGKCRSAYALSPQEAQSQGNFVLEADYDNWIKALTGQAPPIAMIVRNKLMLTKGSLFRLMPFTQSAQELVSCAQGISDGGR